MLKELYLYDNGNIAYSNRTCPYMLTIMMTEVYCYPFVMEKHAGQSCTYSFGNFLETHTQQLRL